MPPSHATVFFLFNLSQATNIAVACGGRLGASNELLDKLSSPVIGCPQEYRAT